jgi:hypothetical protein
MDNGEILVRRIRSIGIRDRPTSPRAPWQNAYAERLIGSIRRECVDQIVVFGERHLRHVLLSYMSYYNGTAHPFVIEQGRAEITRCRDMDTLSVIRFWTDCTINSQDLMAGTGAISVWR